jgi:hypothetical protein
MDITEKNIEESFKRVKKDILALQAHLLEVSGKQAEMMQFIEELSEKIEENPFKKSVSKKKSSKKKR